MKTTAPIQSPGGAEGEILAQRATFLPVETARSRAAAGNFPAAGAYLAGFLPVFTLNGKDLTMAQPLLKEACDEMR